MRTIILSETEKHPIPAGEFRKGDPTSAVIFFGLHDDRGENVVYSSRVTDKFFDVLSKYDLVYYKGDTQFVERLTGYRRFIPPNCTMDMVGVAFHIRKIWNVEKYSKFVVDIADSLEIASADVKNVDVTVKPKVDAPPAPENPLDRPAA